jgi:hypothetical protein
MTMSILANRVADMRNAVQKCVSAFASAMKVVTKGEAAGRIALIP